jgi:hemerythrin-like metal-binding protein
MLVILGGIFIYTALIFRRYNVNGNTHWDSKLMVGSEVIDNQHKVLFDLINDLTNAITTKTNNKVLDALAGVLRDYAFQHFQTEEDFFAGHTDYRAHCLEHYTLLKRLNGFIFDFRNDRIKGDKTPAAFLEDWLFDHIESYDKPFLANETVRSCLLKNPVQIDEFEPVDSDRRTYKRVPHNDIDIKEIHAHYYNASKLKSGSVEIVDMSPGGMMLSRIDGVEIGDLLVISCSIGEKFQMREKVMVRTVHDKKTGVQFISPSAKTIGYFSDLYGSVLLNKEKFD